MLPAVPPTPSTSPPRCPITEAECLTQRTLPCVEQVWNLLIGCKANGFNAGWVLLCRGLSKLQPITAALPPQAIDAQQFVQWGRQVLEMSVDPFEVRQFSPMFPCSALLVA